MKLAFIAGYGFAPSPVWLDEENRFFANAGRLSLLPAGYEALGPKLKEIQDVATAEMVRDVAHRLPPAGEPHATLVDNVLLFDSVAGRYLPGRAVLIADGKVARVGAAGSIRAPAGATTIDGTRQDHPARAVGCAPPCRRR